MQLYWIFFLFLTNVTYGQFANKGWSHQIDTLQLKTTSPNNKKWVVYPLVYQNYALNIYFDQRTLLQLAKQHYKFIKRTGASAYFQTTTPCSADQFARIITHIKQQNHTIIDDQFRQTHANAFSDLKLVIELNCKVFIFKY